METKTMIIAVVLIVALAGAYVYFTPSAGGGNFVAPVIRGTPGPGGEKLVGDKLARGDAVTMAQTGGQAKTPSIAAATVRNQLQMNVNTVAAQRTFLKVSQ